VPSGADGTFTATLPAPSAAQRAKIRYQAVVDGQLRSKALRLERLMVITARKGRTITGRLIVPAKSRPKSITLYRQLTCEKRRVFKTVKLRRDGSFKVTLEAAAAGEPYALYRVTTALRRGKTFTLPIAVR
jgi:hypothetical protein